MELSYRENILQYVKRKYKTRPEYLWARYPTYAVLRRDDNRKWYGIIMNVPRARLGLSGNDAIDILNVKCNAGLYDFLRGERGVLQGYHMGGTWISVLLDGTVPINQIYSLIRCSYDTVDPKQLMT